MRLDPHSLPVSFEAQDMRADGGIRHIELDRERVTLRRAVRGMRMAINVHVRDFLGIAIRDGRDSQIPTGTPTRMAAPPEVRTRNICCRAR